MEILCRFHSSNLPSKLLLLKRRLNIFQTKIKAAIVAAIYTRIYKVAAIINQSNIIMYVLNSKQI